MAFCPSCGAYVPDGTTVCGSCGAAIQQQPQQPQNQQYPPQYPNQNQPYYPQQPNGRMGGGYRANIRKREVVMAIILSIVTCGIYGLIWFFGLVSDLNTAVPEPNDKDPGMVLLLSIVTCGIYSWIWLYNSGEKVDKLRQMNGEMPSNSSTTYLILAILGLGIVDYYLIQSELNKVAMDA